MSKIMNEQNLIHLFRGYYKLGIQNFIGTSAHAIFTGLLFKLNELGFPDSVKTSSREMLSLSGIIDVRTLRNARNKLTQYRHQENNPDSWLIKYIEGNIKEYGTYYINYVILQENYSNITGKLQEYYCKDAVKMSLGDRDRPNEKPDLCVQPAKIVSLSNTIQDKYIYNDQARVLRELIAKKYDICNPLENRNIPTLQFLIDLQKLYDVEYIKQKIAELPKVIVHREISRTLRSWCEHPEKSQHKQTNQSPSYHEIVTAEETKKLSPAMQSFEDSFREYRLKLRAENKSPEYIKQALEEFINEHKPTE
jgi:hypothetical protein